MARRIGPAEFVRRIGKNSDIEGAIAVSAPVAGSTNLYSTVVTTAPGGRTRIHHHGPCETSIYISAGDKRSLRTNLPADVAALVEDGKVQRDARTQERSTGLANLVTEVTHSHLASGSRATRREVELALPGGYQLREGVLGDAWRTARSIWLEDPAVL